MNVESSPEAHSVLLREAIGGNVREFTLEHAAALLKYPSSVWEVAPPGSEPTPQPSQPKKEPSNCYCRTHPNTATLDELPKHCRIHKAVSENLPIWQNEIATSKRNDTSARFREYCEAELNRHSVITKNLAGNLAHPTLYNEDTRPDMLELKMYQQAICELFKAELEQPPAAPQPEPMTSAAAGPVGVRTAEAAPIPVAFPLYIKEEYREKLLPFLAKEYTGQKSKSFACMLWALQELDALNDSPHSNKTELHKSLKSFFGKVGTRQALSSNLKNLVCAKGNEHLQIQAHRERILDFMEAK